MLQRDIISVMHRIAITGATSMLGQALTQEALKAGLEVVAIVRHGSRYASSLPDGVEVVYADMNEYAKTKLSVRPCDCFFHLAWGKTLPSEKDAARSHAENIAYTIDAVLLAHSIGCTAFVGAGSQAEYGVAGERLRPDTPVNPESGYGIAKYAAGKLAALVSRKLGMKYNWLRIVSVYGPASRPPAIVPQLIADFSHGVCPKLTPCDQMWDFLYSSDAARAMLSVAERGITHKSYVLGSGDGHPLRDYVEQIRDIINPAVELKFGTKEYYPHQAKYLVADISELMQDTGWKPLVSFIDGIREIDRTGGGGNVASFFTYIGPRRRVVEKAAA